MRVAESRIAVLESVTSSREQCSRCVRALPVSLPVLKRIGVAAGAAASVLGLCAGLRSKKKAAQKAVGKSPSIGFVLQAVLQVFGPMLLPLLQKKVMNQAGGGKSNQGKPLSF